jgi:hypothetical protein
MPLSVADFVAEKMRRVRYCTRSGRGRLSWRTKRAERKWTRLICAHLLNWKAGSKEWRCSRRTKHVLTRRKSLSVHQHEPPSHSLKGENHLLNAPPHESILELLQDFCRRKETQSVSGGGRTVRSAAVDQASSNCQPERHHLAQSAPHYRL